MDQAWRVAKKGALVMHTDFSYVLGAPRHLNHKWQPVKASDAASPDACEAFPHVSASRYHQVLV